MCGRFTLHTNAAAINAAIGAELPGPFEPEYNIGPGRSVLAVRKDKDGTRAVETPHWGRRSRGHFVINARLETADRIDLFRESWHSSRCALPASGFYEWQRKGERKTPFYFRPEDDDLFFFAGLLFPPAEPDQPTDCVILTTQASAALEAVHHRMPVALAREQSEAWMSGQLERNELGRLTSAFPWSGHPVSNQVNTVRNNGPELIEPSAPAEDPQMPLF